MRRILPSCWSCSAKPKTIAAQRLGIGIVRKGDQGRKTGAATRAMPNVTGVLVAPILGSHRRNQLGIAVNATHQHGDPHSPPRPAIIVPLQIGKSESISGPLLVDRPAMRSAANQSRGKIAIGRMRPKPKHRQRRSSDSVAVNGPKTIRGIKVTMMEEDS